ncbi:phosphatases II [Dentipellis sp. KUC8613]|nr:phosphatases II [Dentipellis sp. KUC8613]
MAGQTTTPNNQELQDLIQGPGDVEWKYDMRHQCQEILPGLLLGPFVVSKSLETLRSLNITHIVCIRDAKEAFSVRPRYPDQFKYLVLDVEDNEEQNLIRLFPSANQFISAALSQGGRVLVHCNGGISLSPAFVIMFVMQHCQMSWEDALHMVQNRRYCISPNGGFLTQIKEYESIYKASIAVSRYPSSARAVPRRKREDDDDHEDMRREDKRPLVDTTMDRDPNTMES